ncbi:MAG TPA: hypothetical protein VK184_06180 [Nostocaceae cyanobacterium]|nr:hypothetical protein [Nostocaceae cyanobacterium]
MSYISLLKSIPDFLSQPTGIAAIASFGIHGAVAVLMPLMTVDSPKTPKPETDVAQSVGVVELPPEAENSLPQVPQSPQFAIQPPQLPQQQNLPLTNPGNALTVLPSGLPPVPSGVLSSRLPVIPQSSKRIATNSLPIRTNLRINSTFSSSNSRFLTQPNIATSNRRLPETNSTISIPENNNPIPSSNQTISDKPLEAPSDKQYDNDIASASDVNPTTTNGGITANNNSGVVIPQNGEKITFSNTDRNSGNSTSEISEQDKRNLERKLAQVDSFQQLRNQVNKEYPNVKEKGAFRQTIPTDKAGVEGKVEGRVVIGTNGEMLDLLFQNRGISPALQSKVREYFKANPPQADKQNISSYPFQISFKRQENNNTRNAESEPTPEAQQSAKPEVKPTPAAQPSTENQGKPNEGNNDVVINAKPTPSNVQPDNSQETEPGFIQKIRENKLQGLNSEQKQ